jgi:hypothetical protein
MTRLLANDRARSAIDLVVVLVLAEIWLWNSTAKDLFRVYAAVVIVLVVWDSFRRRDPDAWKTDQPLWGAGSSWLVAIAMTCALGAAAALSAQLIYIEGEQLRLGRLEEFLDPRVLAGKGLIVILQQFVLYHFLFPSFRKIFRSRALAMAATAVTFGALHLPGVLLVSLTTAMAVVWLHVFERSQRLAPLIVSHLPWPSWPTQCFPSVSLTTLRSVGMPRRLRRATGDLWSACPGHR